MQLYFSGAETKAWHELLQNEGAECVSMSFVSIARRPDYLKPVSYPGSVFIDSGAYSFNKEGAEYTYEDAYEMAAKYIEFVKVNVDTATLISEFDAKQLGLETIKEMRADFYDTLPPDKFMPIWHPEYGKDELEEMCSSYAVVGVCQSDIHGDTENVPLFNSMVSRYGVGLHGVGITSKKLLEAVKWASVSSAAWLTVAQFGDTQIWTGRELKRYPKNYKHHRKTYRTYFTANGFDYQKIEDDDRTELLRLAIWSWTKYIQSLTKVTTLPQNRSGNIQSHTSSQVDIVPFSVRTQEVERRDTITLPVMGTVVPKDSDDRPVLIVRSESMRVCDTCHFKDNCPGFKPNANCLYNIPVEIRTKDQLRALQDSLIEMQTQRVLFMRMGEDFEGGYSDPILSSEMDRLNRMIKAKTDGDKNTFNLSMSMSESASKPSFMERMIGPDNAAKLRQLDAPVNADDIIEAEIVD